MHQMSFVTGWVQTGPAGELKRSFRTLSRGRRNRWDKGEEKKGEGRGRSEGRDEGKGNKERKGKLRTHGSFQKLAPMTTVYYGRTSYPRISAPETTSSVGRRKRIYERCIAGAWTATS